MYGQTYERLRPVTVPDDASAITDPERRGRFVALLDCEHDIGSRKDHEGPCAKPGDSLICRKPGCRGAVRTVVDVVCSGPEPDSNGRPW